MRSGNWPNAGVQKPSAVVTLNGATRDVESVGVVREIPSPLPGQAAAVGGMTAATGSIDWAQGEAVTHRSPTPWTTTGYPSRGEAVTVDATDGVNSYRVFTGVSDGTAGHFSGPDHATGIVDYTDQLNRPFAMDALSRIMPPSEYDTGSTRRMIGLHPAYITDRLMRAGGFYITPPMGNFCVASVPLVGSLWPERGSLRDAYRTDDVYGAGRFNPVWSYEPSWGSMALQNGLAIVRPDVTIYGGQITTSRPLNLSMMVGTYHTTSAYVAAAWTGGTRQIRLAVTGSRSLIGQTRNLAGTVTSVVGITEAEAPGYKTAELRVEVINGGADFRFRLRTDTGVEKEATTPVIENMATDFVDQFWVYAPDNRIAGARMTFAATAWEAVNYVQSARMSYPSSTVQLKAVPHVESGNVLDLLKAQAEATCAAFWIDEDGVLQWKNRDQFTNGTVARTLTAVDDLLDVAFRMDGQDVRRKVTVNYRRASVSTTQKHAYRVYESSKDELEVGDTKEEWIKPGADEDWLMVDESQETIIGGGGTGPFNTGVGTFVGFTGIRDSDGEESIENLGFTRTMTFSKIGSGSWLYHLTITAMPAGISKVTTSAIENGALKDRYRGLGLPVVRAKGLVRWTDHTYTPGVTGPSWAPELDHDVSWFIQDPAEVEALANWIAGELADPHPVVEDVQIIPDPRLQLGDKVKLSDPDRTGVEITGVITSIQQAVTSGDHTMSIRLLVTEVTTPNVNLTEFDAFYSGMTLDEVDTLFSPRTLDDVDAYPLTD